MFNISIADKHWARANLSLITKILSELHFEEVLHFKEIDKVIKSGKSNNRFFDERLVLETQNAHWTFDVRRTIWGMLLIDPESVCCTREGELDAVQLILDIQSLMQISDINLSAFVEEIQQTLFSDCLCLEKAQGYAAEQLVQMSELQRQAFLNAHPKALANKGRLGWGERDLFHYSPESAQAISLDCVAVKKKNFILACKLDSLNMIFGASALAKMNGEGYSLN